MEVSFGSVWVAGEISNLARPQSGHCYLTLKDDQAQIRCALWRNAAARVRFDLHDGLEVVCRGRIDVYAPRGTYQLIIESIEPKGMGALELALRQLREKLAREGLFDPRRKRPLPPFVRRIAVVTSPTGAAIHDFLQVLGRRWRGADVIVVPTRVQGDGAAAEIAAAIAMANRLPLAIDCLVVTRGGGSLEDLWAFNEEAVVRAIHASRIPVISAIGHEIDVTLADLVADVPRPDAQRGGRTGGAGSRGSLGPLPPDREAAFRGPALAACGGQVAIGRRRRAPRLPPAAASGSRTWPCDSTNSMPGPIARAAAAVAPCPQPGPAAGRAAGIAQSAGRAIARLQPDATGGRRPDRPRRGGIEAGGRDRHAVRKRKSHEPGGVDGDQRSACRNPRQIRNRIGMIASGSELIGVCHWRLHRLV